MNKPIRYVRVGIFGGASRFALDVVYREHFNRCASITEGANPSVVIPAHEVTAFIEYGKSRDMDLREM